MHSDFKQSLNVINTILKEEAIKANATMNKTVTEILDSKIVKQSPIDFYKLDIIKENKTLVYKKLSKFNIDLPLESQTYKEFEKTFIGYLYSIKMSVQTTSFLSDGKKEIIIKMQIHNYLNEPVKIKKDIFIKYDNTIFKRTTDENGQYLFKIKTLKPGIINVKTVNSDMFNSNIAIDALG